MTRRLRFVLPRMQGLFNPIRQASKNLDERVGHIEVRREEFRLPGTADELCQARDFEESDRIGRSASHHCHRQFGLHQAGISMHESSSRTRGRCKRTNFRRERAREMKEDHGPRDSKRGSPTNKSQNTGVPARRFHKLENRIQVFHRFRQDKSKTTQAFAIVIVPQTSANGWWRLDGLNAAKKAKL